MPPAPSSSPDSHFSSRAIHPDHLGSTRVCTDSSGNPLGTCAYEPFGEFRGGATSCSVPTNYRFAGMEWDAETGLYHTWFRQYDATQGRWMGVDPLPGSEDDPQSLDRYVYVRNDPVNLIDPLGLAHDCEFSVLRCEGENSQKEHGTIVSVVVCKEEGYFCGGGGSGGGGSGGGGGGGGIKAAKQQLSEIAEGKFTLKEECKKFLEALIEQNNLKISLDTLVNQIMSAARGAMNHLYDGLSATSVPFPDAEMFPGESSPGSTTVADHFAYDQNRLGLSQANGFAMWIRADRWAPRFFNSLRGPYGSGVLMHELLHKNMVGGGFSHLQIENALEAAGMPLGKRQLFRERYGDLIGKICF